jgi:hypothetical protein
MTPMRVFAIFALLWLVGCNGDRMKDSMDSRPEIHPIVAA